MMDYQPYTLTTPKVTTKKLILCRGGSSHQIALLRLRLYSAPLWLLEGAPPEILTSVLFLLKNKSASPIFTSNSIPTNFFSPLVSPVCLVYIWCIHDVRVQQKALSGVQIWRTVSGACSASDQPGRALAKSLNIIILHLIREMKS